MSPVDKTAIKNLARLYFKRNRTHDAIALFNRLVNADVTEPLPDNYNAAADLDFESLDGSDDEYRESERVRIRFY